MSATVMNKLGGKYPESRFGYLSIEDNTTNNNMQSETRGTTPLPPENRQDKSPPKEIKRPQTSPGKTQDIKK